MIKKLRLYEMDMRYFRFILFPFALIYGIAVGIRNLFYQKRILKSSKFSLPIINIGNLSVGGTGKTPHTEYLICLLKKEYNLVTLSRGYGRKERGFILADETATAQKIGDEPMQYQTKFSNEIGVAVDVNRVNGVISICQAKPDTNVILLDDAYQHRAIAAGLNILITTYQNPFFKDFILPVGTLREARKGKKRADIVIVSKCPDLSLVDKAKIEEKIAPKKGQKVFFSRIIYGAVYPLMHKEVETFKNNKVNNRSIVLVTGIAKPEPLLSELSKTNKILKHFKFSDHYQFKEDNINEVHNLIDKFASENPLIVTTEKDAMRLVNQTWSNKLNNYQWVYQSIEVEIDEHEEFDRIIREYVEKNS